MPDFDLDSALAEPPPVAFHAKVPLEHEVVDIGIENSQYFQGLGRGNFDDAVTGVGDTPTEAFEDALEMAAQDGWLVDDIPSPYTAEHDAEYCVSVRNRREWEADLNPDGLDGLTGDERTERIDELWQEACEDGYGQDIYYYVGIRLREHNLHEDAE